MHRPHVVIIGAGFGGTYAARHLLRAVKKGVIELTLINRTNYFLFTPLLHEVATGGLTPTSITEPLSEILAHSNIRIIVGEAALNLTRQTVKINGKIIPFDYALITTGAETNFFNISGAREHALPLKTMGDAMRIRERVISAFDRARNCRDHEERRRQLSFVVVGAGPTGVELVGELSQFAHEIHHRYNRGHREFSVTLIGAEQKILDMLPPTLQKRTEQLLKAQHINLIVGTPVVSINNQSVTLANHKKIPAGIILWTAGVTAVQPKTNPVSIPVVCGRVIVDDYLRLEGSDCVFAIGDTAAAKMDSPGKRFVPMLAQSATAEAKVAAHNILATIAKQPLRRFHFRSKGMLISVGQWHAIGTIGPMYIWGPVAWWIWRTVYLFKFVSIKKRLRIALEWTIDIFTTRDISQLTER